MLTYMRFTLINELITVPHSNLFLIESNSEPSVHWESVQITPTPNFVE